ncbi:hypothetical protein GH714_031688 [Hevea brasiliensis]|uniref:C3H1-type domain-containing protein n=1 Tax=Hevea brasiliensis TaxID=3981 RepID=A0A6A6M267_HEVBR|nr:hypothetical protein GH714_031688 [Hevea brasiliensis]
MMNLGPAVTPVSRNLAVPSVVPNGSASTAVKRRLCNKYNSSEGCKFGDKCHFAHGEWELGKPIASSHEDARAIGTIPGRMGGRMEPPSPGLAASFGASATAKISVEASLAGAIIGKAKTTGVPGAAMPIQEATIKPRYVKILAKDLAALVKDATLLMGPLNCASQACDEANQFRKWFIALAVVQSLY